ncbi:hypothetical protein OUZ56_008249 [Daphnia magna]|uniref:Uncharacterized protein n=1 Tax=Daphnia magna TaxID=35525 RepID=A0ABR0ACG5_9CRUS|nr:hypothetical protein OUZ56_008249 [Daphnia magna]
MYQSFTPKKKKKRRAYHGAVIVYLQNCEIACLKNVLSIEKCAQQKRLVAILNVKCTDFPKNQQIYILIFCRSVSHSNAFDNRTTAAFFNQTAPDCLEDELLLMLGKNSSSRGIRKVVAFWLDFLHRQMHPSECCSLPLHHCSQNFYALFLSQSYIDSQTTNPWHEERKFNALASHLHLNRSNARDIPPRPATYHPATHPSTEC